MTLTNDRTTSTVISFQFQVRLAFDNFSCVLTVAKVNEVLSPLCLRHEVSYLNRRSF